MLVNNLLDVARAFLRTAREEIDEGLRTRNYVKVRDGAEKAWNAVVQASDHLLKRHGRTPLPGAGAHRDRRDFLESVGRADLAVRYSFFADRLHGDIFYDGHPVPAGTLTRYLSEVEDYLRQVEAA